MAYEDKVVEVLVDVPTVLQEAGSGGNFTGLVVKETSSTTLTGLGTTPSPLQANVNISRKESNRLTVLTGTDEKGLFVAPSDTKVSAREGNIISYVSASDAAGAGNPALEGVYADPVNVSTTSPNKTISIKADSTGKKRTQIDVSLVVDDHNALKSSATGLEVPVSKALDNTLEIRSGALYVRPQEAKISELPENKLELKPDGLYVTTVKGDKGEKGDTGPEGPQGPQGEAGKDGAAGATGPQGPKGDKGDMGLGLNVIARLDNESQLPPVTDYKDGDTFVIDGHFWTRIVDGGIAAWTDIGNFIGPQGLDAYEVAVSEGGFVGTVEEWLVSLKGKDGIGLTILGSFANVGDLPTSGNTSGDAYIVQEQMWVWDSNKWSPVGQVGPEGKSAYQVWLANGHTGSQLDFLADIKGEKGDTGPQGPIGPKGEDGVDGKNANAVNILGSVADEGSLPSGASAGDAYLIGANVWVYTGTGWEDLGAFQGPQGPEGKEGIQGLQGPQGPKGADGANGKDNYAIAVEAGFQGSVTEYLASLKGPKGDQGPQGPRGATGPKGDIGDGLHIDGTVATVPELPADAIDGTTYLVGTDLYLRKAGAWVNLGPVRGPAGVQGPQGPAGAKGDTGERGAQGVQGAVGPQGPVGPKGDAGAKGERGDTGPQGPAGPKGDQGEAGTGLVPKGEKPAVGDLPPTGNTVGDLWIVQGEGWVWDGTTWISIGDIKGPKGDTGAKGDTGPKGDQGDMGPTLTPKGDKPSVPELPSSGNTLGDLWTVLGVAYGWDGTAWVNLGQFQGPQGPKGLDGIDGIKGDQGDRGEQGPQGPVGPEGPQGPQGEMGAGVKILGKKDSSSELPPDGVLGEGYLIAGDFWGWTGTAYENLGPIQGPKGDTGPRGLQGLQGAVGEKGPKGDKGDNGNKWILGSGAPTPATGSVGDYYLDQTLQEIYLKQTNELWVKLEGHLGGGNVYDAPSDGVRRVRVNGAWAVETQAQKIGVISTTTPVVDLGKQTVAFTLDNTGATAKTISFTNVPTNEYMLPISIVIKGKAGVLTWPSNVKWSGSTAPTYGEAKTVVVILWDGEEFLATVGPSY